MATPSGTIAASDINTELGRASGTSLNMNERVIRQLANSVTNANMSPASTSISFDNLRNKSRIQTQTLSRGSEVVRNVGDAGYSDWLDIGGGSWRWELSVQNLTEIRSEYEGPIGSNALDIQFSTVSALRADPNNWAVTTSGASYGIRLTASGYVKNSSDTNLYVGFFDRAGIGSTWIPPDPPLTYTYTNKIALGSFPGTSPSAWSISDQLIAWNEAGLQAESPLEWTVNRLKTVGVNNYLSIIGQTTEQFTFTTSYIQIDSISITVQTIIN